MAKIWGKTNILNKLNHKRQSHARVCNENEENKEENHCSLFFKSKDRLWVVIMDDARSGFEWSLQKWSIIQQRYSYYSNNLVGYNIIKY